MASSSSWRPKVELARAQPNSLRQADVLSPTSPTPYLTREETLKLSQMINQSDHYEDNTEAIRKIKHSNTIRENMKLLTQYRNDNVDLQRLNYDEFVENAKTVSFFLYEAYTDIFFKVLKNEIDEEIMNRLLDVLHMIEESKVDQQEGSVLVGKILKELYIDSATKRTEKMKEKDLMEDIEKCKEMNFGSNISYKQFAQMRKDKKGY